MIRLRLSEEIAPICDAWENQFTQLFESLAIKDTKNFTEKFIKPVHHLPSLSSYIEIVTGEQEIEDTSDLAD